ncbi:GNAT family N-acetyltransferase [Stenotrophomonas sp. CPCC 101365]|uniref:GNAT family N-acetyltransferase n=1 Tax=Stenotrophomonas mori TaxID=2871096 RepID=A0ABT0SHN6_9GAMM|nr:GNAT family N-acetyltransferase [Stenotrophomonas mori]
MPIRDYRPEDWPRLCAIHDPARRQELHAAGLAPAFVPLETAAAREGLFDYRLLVAEAGGRVRGFAAFGEDELAWLYVEPASQRRGIATALVDAVVAATRGPLAVEVLEGNGAAIAFYEARGFQRVRRAHGRLPGNESFAVSVQVLALAERRPDRPAP